MRHWNSSQWICLWTNDCVICGQPNEELFIKLLAIKLSNELSDTSNNEAPVALSPPSLRLVQSTLNYSHSKKIRLTRPCFWHASHVPSLGHNPWVPFLIWQPPPHTHTHTSALISLKGIWESHVLEEQPKKERRKRIAFWFIGTSNIL